MLTICADTLPPNTLTYLAFRLSCLETFRLLEEELQHSQAVPERLGYLTEVPFLQEVAPRVQLSLLGETWNRHMSNEAYHADLVDESVVYAVCEFAAALIEKAPERVREYLGSGPLAAQVVPDHFLATELRALHLQLSNEGDFLLISQLQDLPPDEAAEFKHQFHLNDAYLQPMFDVLGRWYVSPHLREELQGLLTDEELDAHLPTLGLISSLR
jgi:hypothetical protein